MQHPRPTPERIVERDGRVHVGWFEQPFVEANLQDARRSLFRRMRLKQWHYTSVVSPRLFFACAVVDVGYVGNAFAYVVDRQSGKAHEFRMLSPLAAGITVAANSIDGTTSVNKSGWGHIALGNDSKRGKRYIDVRLDGRLGTTPAPALRAELEIADRGGDPDPIVVVEESEPGCYLYTHKCYGLNAGGRVRCGDLDVTLEMGDGHAGLDFNRGFRPRQTWWNWAAAGGYASDGARVGFNLTAHRRWDDPSSLEEDAADCAIWLDGMSEKISRVEFDYDPSDLMLPWQIRDSDGLVDLRFSPIGERHEDVDFGIVVSRFHQPYGLFEGELRSRKGRSYAIRDVFGVTEQHFAKW